MTDTRKTADKAATATRKPKPGTTTKAAPRRAVSKKPSPKRETQRRTPTAEPKTADADPYQWGKRIWPD